MKKILMIAAAAAVCLAACSKNEDGIPGDRTLRITPVSYTHLTLPTTSRV